MPRIISYNIRYNNPGDGENAWPHRKNRVTDLLQHHLPDLIGLQEVRKDQLDDLIPRLPDFDWVGVGRDDGKTQGEFAAIFYRRARFELTESGSIWLSETPDVVGSVGWDASMARIATWAEFVDTQRAIRLRHVNTHFDHRGVIAQVESACLLRRFLAEREPALPTIITGDFNITPASPAYLALTALEIALETAPNDSPPPLLDAMYHTQTPHEGPNETFNGTFSDPLEAKIDYIFVWEKERGASAQVQRHAILRDNQAGWYPSDHLPVLADILLG